MMVTIESYIRQGRRLYRQIMGNMAALTAIQAVGYLGAGLLLSGASLGGGAQTLCLGLLCAVPAGWPLLLLALGSAGGYLLFWGSVGVQGVAWVFCGLLSAGLLGGRRSNLRKR